MPEVDEAIAAWPGQVLGDPEVVAEIEAFVAAIGGHGRSNSLGQKLLQLAGPGVPDVYQGTELFEYSLVDPDNRRPVDFDLRRRLLERLDGGWMPSLDADEPDELAAVKLRSRPRRCACGASAPSCSPATRRCPPPGRPPSHAVAFARGGSAGRERLVAVATRLPVGLEASGGWRDTVLPLPAAADDWTDVITGRPVDGSAPALGALLDRFPVALLVRPA